MPNAVRYGFRWASSENGKSCPHGVPMLVASGQAFTPDSATAAELRVGDPVSRIAGGYLDHTAPGSALGVWGIVVGIGHDGKVFNSSIGSGVLHPSTAIPSGVVYGTNLELQTIALVVPAGGAYWEVDADHTLASLAAWQAVYGQNADHSFTAAAADLAATPELDAPVAAPGSATWRIERVSGTQHNQDFTAANVKLIVTLNEGQAPPYNTAGI